MLEQHLYKILEELNISYQRIDHAPVYTSEQARKLIPLAKGASAKNLFLRDRKGKRHFLVLLNDNKEFDLSNLAKQIDSTRLSFASPERLMKHLSVEPGAVSPLALINDPAHNVELWIEQGLMQEEMIQCHPLINTATLVLPVADLAPFFQRTGHIINVFTI